MFHKKAQAAGADADRILFTKEMKKTHTILLPMMLPIHFELVKNVFLAEGYNVVLLKTEGPEIARTGLKYVNNDTCYPALLVIGQMIDALIRGGYDPERTALMITQTGGGCRASNYIHLLRKALVRAGFDKVPVVSLNLSGMEPNPGFQITLSMLRKFIAGIVYGDELMLLSNQIRPYENTPGSVDALLEAWTVKLSEQFRAGKGYTLTQMRPMLLEVARDFEKVAVTPRKAVKVGIVGEIYVKYASLGNNGLEKFLQKQGCEYMTPGLMDFALFSINNKRVDHKLYGGGLGKMLVAELLFRYLTSMERALHRAVDETRLVAPASFVHTRSLIGGEGCISQGSCMGEGWLLTAEMLALAGSGYENIVCAQPFGCLPNHINGRGMMNSVKARAPRANIVAIDYDPGAARVNQENRIKLMLADATPTDPITKHRAQEAQETPVEVLGEVATAQKN